MDGESNQRNQYKVLLVHGALADERMWREHMDLLSGEYTVSAVTLGHFGRDGESARGPFGMNGHADELADHIFRVSPGAPVHVAAWSYGADVALNALVRHPDKFASLMLYEPGYPGCLDEEEMHAFAQDAGAMFGPVFKLDAEGQTRRAVEALVDRSAGRVGYFAAQPEEIRNQQLENGHTLHNQLHQQETPDLGADRLSGIAVPVTVAWGEDTRMLFLAVSVGVAEAVPTARAVSVEGAGHMLPLDDPRRFTDLIREHLSGAAGR